MKKNVLLITFCLGLNFICSSQIPTRRSIKFHNFPHDSTNLYLSEDYNLIEDSCARIIRYGHLKMRERKFFGRFKDVSVDNPDLIVSEGNYDERGLKDGAFISHYLNGNLQAKGNFKENKLDGRWEFYYATGKPKLILEALNNDIKIIDAWDEEGKKIVDNGNGKYSVDLTSLVWQGKLNNGKPDGTWKATKASDRTNTALVTEHFKNGQFQKGTNVVGNYSDTSHIVLFSENDLPLINAEKMKLATSDCNSTRRKKIVIAQYQNGPQAFSEKIKDLVTPYLSHVDLKPYDTELEITGEISTKGFLEHITYSAPGFDDKIASGLVRELYRLPSMEPALVDGNPVTQRITFSFKFMSGIYRYSYRLLPIKVN